MLMIAGSRRLCMVSVYGNFKTTLVSGVLMAVEAAVPQPDAPYGGNRCTHGRIGKNVTHLYGMARPGHLNNVSSTPR
jgi:hypothetical protein